MTDIEAAVAKARGEVMEAILLNEPDASYNDEVSAALDHYGTLKAAVARAQMPCYGGCSAEELARYGPDGELGDGIHPYLCPACSAEAELARLIPGGAVGRGGAE